MSLSLPESYVGLVSADPRELIEHGDRVQQNFDRIASQWPKPPRIVRGRVDGTTPTTLQGEGFTVTKLFVGVYTVTFDTAFAATPVVVLTTEVVGSARLANPVAGLFQLGLENNAGAAVDGVFTFTAVES